MIKKIKHKFNRFIYYLCHCYPVAMFQEIHDSYSTPKVKKILASIPLKTKQCLSIEIAGYTSPPYEYAIAKDYGIDPRLIGKIMREMGYRKCRKPGCGYWYALSEFDHHFHGIND